MLMLTVGYKTATGNELTLDIHGMAFERDAIPIFYPKEDLPLLCNASGCNCKGFGGSCPPYAPYFPDIKPSSPYFYVVCIQLDLAWALKYAGNLEYFKFSYADQMTHNYIHRVVTSTAARLKGYGLTCGGCRICKTGKDKPGCVVLQGQPCIYPDRRTYSVEATGVDCSTLHEMMFGTRLPYWYYDGVLPHYMFRYGGVFVKDVDKCDNVLRQAAYDDKSFTPTIQDIPQYRLVEHRVRDDNPADAGLEFEGYHRDDYLR